MCANRILRSYERACVDLDQVHCASGDPTGLHRARIITICLYASAHSHGRGPKVRLITMRCDRTRRAKPQEAVFDWIGRDVAKRGTPRFVQD
jgi:hypothetical protein